eukprot:6990677-Prorocentrum_lima.AAC.1
MDGDITSNACTASGNMFLHVIPNSKAMRLHGPGVLLLKFRFGAEIVTTHIFRCLFENVGVSFAHGMRGHKPCNAGVGAKTGSLG